MPHDDLCDQFYDNETILLSYLAFGAAGASGSGWLRFFGNARRSSHRVGAPGACTRRIDANGSLAALRRWRCSRAIGAVLLIGLRISLENVSKIQKIVADQSRNEGVNPHDFGWVQASSAWAARWPARPGVGHSFQPRRFPIPDVRSTSKFLRDCSGCEGDRGEQDELYGHLRRTPEALRRS